MYRDRSTVIRKIVIISALLLILGGGIFALHSVYTVRTVYVEGNVHYTEDEIKKIVMSGPLGNNSLCLGEFFAFITNADIQLIIETHCDHLINKLQYLVFKKKFESDKAIIYYKKGIVDPFEKIQLNKYGRFEPEFPDGFFDATLAELIEME